MRAPVHILYQFKDQAGASFRPSNGTEGMTFDDAFCNRCEHDRAWRERANLEDNPRGCQILSDAMLYDQDDNLFPKEWQYDEDGWPTCTEFEVKRLPGQELVYRCESTIDMFT